jgi:hypothetical protein
MKNPNELYRAFLFAVGIAAVLAIVGYVVPRPDGAVQNIYRIADALVTGGLGFFAGRASQNPTQPETPATTKD